MPATATQMDPLVGDRRSELPQLLGDTAPGYSFRQLLRSRYHSFWYHLGERLAWSRGTYRERPTEELHDLSGIQHERIASLQRYFRVRFEDRATQATALKQYDYLDILDQAWSTLKLPVLTGGVVQDIGPSNFWYASVLHTFFRPTELVGIEVEGHRIYLNAYSRLDYARGYIENLPKTEFLIRDYCGYDHPAHIVMAWYPFVTPNPILAWRMPLSLLTPHAIFSQVARNLQPHGLFLMVNQGRGEASIAAAWCRKAGLVRHGICELRPIVRPRIPALVFSCWRRPPA